MQKHDEPLLFMPYKFMFSLLVLLGAVVTGLKAQFKPGERTVTCQRENIRFAEFFSIVWDQTRLQAFYNDEQLSSEKELQLILRANL